MGLDKVDSRKNFKPGDDDLAVLKAILPEIQPQKKISRDFDVDSRGVDSFKSIYQTRSGGYVDLTRYSNGSKFIEVQNAYHTPTRLIAEPMGLEITSLDYSANGTLKFQGRRSHVSDVKRLDPAGVSYVDSSGMQHTILDGKTDQVGYSYLNLAKLRRLADTNLPLLTNKNGVVSTEAIGRAMEDKRFKGENAEFVAWVYSNFLSLTCDSSSTGVNARGIKNALDYLKSYTGLYTKYANSLSMSERFNCHRTDKLYISQKPIDMRACKQDGLGDCFFVAVEAGIAEHDPELIRNAISYDKSGKISVSFAGTPNEHYQMQAPSEAECAIYGASPQFGYWPAVLAKAFGMHKFSDLSKHKLSESDPVHEFCNDLTTPKVAAEAIANGGDEAEVLRVMTGRPVTAMCLPGIKDADWESALLEISNPHCIAVAGTWVPTDKDIPPTHAYTVVKVDKGEITLRNPWGNENGGPYGNVFTISLQKFKENFNFLTYAAAPTATSGALIPSSKPER